MICIGQSNYASWGATLLYSDVLDLYKEKVENNKYFYDNKWYPL